MKILRIAGIIASLIAAVALLGAQPTPQYMPKSGGTFTGVVRSTSSLYIGGGNPWNDAIYYGADPTNTLDSTTAIQNCLNASISGHGACFAPKGHYKTLGMLTLYGSGTGPGLMGFAFEGSNVGGTIIDYQGGSLVNAVLEVNVTSSHSTQCCSSNLAIRNISFTGNGNNTYDLAMYNGGFWDLTNVIGGGGNASNGGCFYFYNTDGNGFHNLGCTPANFSATNFNGLVWDGAGGASASTSTIDNFGAGGLLGTALLVTPNGGALTVSKVQLGGNHQNISLQGGYSTVSGLSENGTVPDLLAGNNNRLENVFYSGNALEMSGFNWTVDTAFLGTTTIDNTSRGGRMLGVTIDPSVLTDNSPDTEYEQLTTGDVKQQQRQATTNEICLGTGGNLANSNDPVCTDWGTWIENPANTPIKISPKTFTTGKAWKATLTGTFTSSGGINAAPFFQISDVNPTITLPGPLTITFSVNGSGKFQMTSATNLLGFIGTIQFTSLQGSAAGAATTIAAQYADTVQAGAFKTTSGTAMTGDQGNGAKVQHATGSPATGNALMYDSNGNAIDSTAAIALIPRYCGDATFSASTSSGTVSCSFVSTTSKCVATWIGAATSGGALACAGTGVGTAACTSQNANSSSARLFCAP